MQLVRKVNLFFTTISDRTREKVTHTMRTIDIFCIVIRSVNLKVNFLIPKVYFLYHMYSKNLCVILYAQLFTSYKLYNKKYTLWVENLLFETQCETLNFWCLHAGFVKYPIPMWIWHFTYALQASEIEPLAQNLKNSRYMQHVRLITFPPLRWKTTHSLKITGFAHSWHNTLLCTHSNV